MALFALLNQKIEAKEIRSDTAQKAGAKKLDEFEQNLRQKKRKFSFRKATGSGFYLWGSVGTGKSMLMDLFFEHSAIEQKKRQHFHPLMLGVHAKLDSLRQEKCSDPMRELAKRYGKTIRLLCLDEFQVSDIADAMLLGRLFEQFFDHGISIVTTSNRHPDDLYENGLQRERFLPAIALIKQKMEIFELRAEKDYRLDRLRERELFLSPIDAENQGKFERLWQEITAGMQERKSELKVMGRRLCIPRRAGSAARLSFDALCDQPLGAADYLALAANFSTIFIETLPALGPEKRNQAARFVKLIDAVYESRCKLVVLSEVPAAEIYAQGDGSFEFARTVSRLREMVSEEYIKLEHQPQAVQDQAGSN